MYSIGEFSKIGKVSTKMLRHYDKIGLLKPEYTNAENGYRFYSRDQIKTILLVNKLKEYRFSLEEISGVLNNPDTELLKCKMEEKIRLLQDEITRGQMLLGSLEEEIWYLAKGEDLMVAKRKFDVVLEEMKPMAVACVRRTISMSEVGNLFGEVYSNLFKNNLTPAGDFMTLYYDEDFDPEHADLEVCIPIAKKVDLQGLDTRIIDGGLYAHTTFVGPYSEIGEGYAALMDWIKENNCEIIGPCMDKYIKGPESKCSPNEFITEIYFPVRKK